MNIIFTFFLKAAIMALTFCLVKGQCAKSARSVGWLELCKHKIRHESIKRTRYCRNTVIGIQAWPFSKGLFSDLVEMVL